jgi:hypothetical protein
MRCRCNKNYIPKEENMTPEVEPTKDRFWLYVAGATIALVGTILMVKLSENEKYDPIIQQQNEEMARMNIRVVK